jgi:RecB family exonuclease
LESAIQLGEQALREGNQIAGKRASLLLQNKIMGSGTASQLFIAERAMHAAPPEVTYALAEAVSALRRAYHRKDKSEMERLSAELRLAVARLAAQRARIAGIEDRQDLAKEGRLRVRD